MGIPKGYVCEPYGHSLAHNLPRLKANILVNYDGHACWIDFGLSTIIAEKEAITSSTSAGGTIRWMGPELLDPQAFGSTDGHPTRESDCYSLGMVIYEVLSGRVPFHSCGFPLVFSKVLNGERPEKPEGALGAWFTTEIWTMLELCWKPRPADRPSSRDILWGLERAQPPSRSFPPYVDTMDMDEERDPDVISSGPGTSSLHGLWFQAHLRSSGLSISYYGLSHFTTLVSGTLPRPTQTLKLASNYPHRIIALARTYPESGDPTPYGHPPGLTSVIVTPELDKPQIQVQEVNPDRLGRRLVRGVRKMFNATP